MKIFAENGYGGKLNRKRGKLNRDFLFIITIETRSNVLRIHLTRSHQRVSY